MTPTFRVAFCHAFKVDPKRFGPAALRRCFPVHSRPLGALLLLLAPRVLRQELAVMEELGNVADESEFKTVLESYVYEIGRDRAHFRTRTLGLRISRRRFLRLARAARLRAEGPSSAVSDAAGDPGSAPVLSDR